MKHRCNIVNNRLCWNAENAPVDVYFDGKFALTTSESECDLPSTYTPTTFSVVTHIAAYDVAPTISELGDGDQARLKFASKPTAPYVVKNAATNDVVASSESLSYVREYLSIGNGLIYLDGQPERPEEVTITLSPDATVSIGDFSEKYNLVYNGVIISVMALPTTEATAEFAFLYDQEVTTLALAFGQNALVSSDGNGTTFSTAIVDIPFQKLNTKCTIAGAVLTVDFTDSRVAKVEVFTNINATFGTLADRVIFDSPAYTATPETPSFSVPIGAAESGTLLVVLRAYDSTGYSNTDYTTYSFDIVANTSGVGTIGITDAYSAAGSVFVRVHYTRFAGLTDTAAHLRCDIAGLDIYTDFTGSGLYEFSDLGGLSLSNGWQNVTFRVTDGGYLESNAVTTPVYFYHQTTTEITSEATPC